MFAASGYNPVPKTSKSKKAERSVPTNYRVSYSIPKSKHSVRPDAKLVLSNNLEIHNNRTVFMKTAERDQDTHIRNYACTSFRYLKVNKRFSGISLVFTVSNFLLRVSELFTLL